jgi:O-antigen/teichoic acid export membrane protein
MMKYSVKYYAGIAISCALAVSVLSRPLLLVFTTQQIAANGYLVTPLVAAAALLLGAYTMFVQVISLKKTAVIGTMWVLSAALNFGANLVLIPYFGITGAALTTFIAFLLAFVLTTVYLLRQLKFDVSSRFVLKSASASIVMSRFLLL